VTTSDPSSGSGQPSAGSGEPAAVFRHHWLRDWRVWLGVAISVVCLWLVMRGIPIAEVAAAMERADLPLLLALSVPAYVANVVVRALRWRHLTNPIAPISRATLFRGASIGFMVNNLAPLRIGELVRSWYVARESSTSTSAILGTVVLERVVDVVTVLAIAAVALAWLGVESEETGLLREGAILTIPVALAPLFALLALRLAPDRVIAIVHFFARPFPEGMGHTLESALRRFAEGLGALSGGSHLFWIFFYSLLIWLVFSTLPLLAGTLAFGLDLGPPGRTLMTCWILLAAVGVAVALPSAPGFFGPYQLAFQAVLERFGVEPATALALGLLVWFVFWATLTLLGLIVMRSRGVRLDDLAG